MLLHFFFFFLFLHISLSPQCLPRRVFTVVLERLVAQLTGISMELQLQDERSTKLEAEFRPVQEERNAEHREQEILKAKLVLLLYSFRNQMDLSESEGTFEQSINLLLKTHIHLHLFRKRLDDLSYLSKTSSLH